MVLGPEPFVFHVVNLEFDIWGHPVRLQDVSYKLRGHQLVKDAALRLVYKPVLDSSLYPKPQQTEKHLRNLSPTGMPKISVSEALSKRTADHHVVEELDIGMMAVS